MAYPYRNGNSSPVMGRQGGIPDPQPEQPKSAGQVLQASPDFNSFLGGGTPTGASPTTGQPSTSFGSPSGQTFGATPPGGQWSPQAAVQQPATQAQGGTPQSAVSTGYQVPDLSGRGTAPPTPQTQGSQLAPFDPTYWAQRGTLGPDTPVGQPVGQPQTVGQPQKTYAGGQTWSQGRAFNTYADQEGNEPVYGNDPYGGSGEPPSGLGQPVRQPGEPRVTGEDAYKQYYQAHGWPVPGQPQGSAAQGGTTTQAGNPPPGVNAADPKWQQWMSPEGKIPNERNITSFLQTHFGGSHNKAGLQEALPYLQWVFGSGIKIHPHEAGDTLILPDGSFVDVISNVKSASGGDAWSWTTESEAGTGAGQPRSGGGYQGGQGQAQMNFNASNMPNYQPFGGYQNWGGENAPAPYQYTSPSNIGQMPTYTPQTFSTEGLPTYNPYQFNQEGLPQYNQFQYNQAGLPQYNQFQYNQQGLPTYQAGQLNQYQAPDQTGMNQLQTSTMQQMLNNPTLSNQVQAQMREQQKDRLLSMGEQLGQQASQRAANLGRTGGGMYGQQMGDIQAAQMGDLTKGYRDLDVQAAQINRQARERALGMSENLLQGQLGRGVQAYQTGLQGQLSQEELNRAAIASQQQARQFGREGEQLQASEGRYAQEAGERGRQFGRAGEQLQAEEGRFGYGTEAAARQFGRETEQLQAGEGQRGYQSQVLNRQFGREGEQLQAAENFRGYGSQAAANESMFNRYLQGQGLQQQAAQSRFQNWMGGQGNQLANRQLQLQQYLGQQGAQRGAYGQHLSRLQMQNQQNNWMRNWMSGLLG